MAELRVTITPNDHQWFLVQVDPQMHAVQQTSVGFATRIAIGTMARGLLNGLYQEGDTITIARPAAGTHRTIAAAVEHLEEALARQPEPALW